MTWPEGDELLPNEIRPAGTPIGMFLVFLVCVCILNTEKMLFFLTFHGEKNDKKIKTLCEDLTDKSDSLGVTKMFLFLILD